MTALKKTVTFLLALLLTVSACAVSASAKTDTFTPVLRFIAASDTHVRDDNDTTQQRIGKMLRLGYADAANDPDHPTLDAVLIAGDLTHDGTYTEFQKFRDAVNGSLQDGTQFLGVVAHNHDGYDMRQSKVRSVYKEMTGNDADIHAVINGFHFIGISVSSREGIFYDAGQLRWLKKQLDEAVADDPDKPIFVFHHEHVFNTVYGSSLYSGWGLPFFTPILRQYPQVVDFSGHSHYPLNDPRSIWQGAFTAIGTGAIYYTECTVDAVRTYHPAGAYEVATCWIVEADAAGNIRLRGMDVNAGEVLCEYMLDNPADPANRAYTPENRKAASASPVFASGDALRVTEQDGKCVLQIPAAKSTDGMPVVLYRVSVRNANGVTVFRDWVMPQYYTAAAQDTVEYTVRGVPAGTYTVCVTAETAYGISSEPLETQVHISSRICPYCGKTHTGIWGVFLTLLHRIAFVFGRKAG